MAAIAASICHVCGEDATARCSACKAVFYCSTDHQRQDWPEHKPDCAARVAAAKKAAEYQAQLEEQPFVAGRCGIHRAQDVSQYMHALNNMAGGHKIDKPLGDNADEEFDDEFEQDDIPWTAVDGEDLLLNHGVRIVAGSSYRRQTGELGHGINVRGRIRVGEHVYEVEDESQQIQLPSGLVVSEHMVTGEGASIDGFLIVRGPLTYCNNNLSADMGVHYSGTAFQFVGEPPRYSELCVDRLLHLAGQAAAP